MEQEAEPEGKEDSGRGVVGRKRRHRQSLACYIVQLLGFLSVLIYRMCAWKQTNLSLNGQMY